MEKACQFSHMDVISARDAQVAREPAKEKSSPYINDAGPPLMRPSCNKLDSDRQSRKLI